MGNIFLRTGLWAPILSDIRGTMVRRGPVGSLGRRLPLSTRAHHHHLQYGKGNISSSNVSEPPLVSFVHLLTDLRVGISDWSSLATTSSHVVHADNGYHGGQRRMPRYMARGAFNQFGYDKGINAIMTHNERGLWELEVCLFLFLLSISVIGRLVYLCQIMARWPSSVQLNVFAYDDFFYGDIDGDGIIDRIPPNSPGTRLVICYGRHESHGSEFSP
jgi:hypothetical protein